MSTTTLRHLAILRRIPRSPKTTTAPDLMPFLHDLGHAVDLRTVQRDLEALSAVFPLYCDAGVRPFRWQWPSGCESFDIPGLDTNTALVVKLAGMFLEPLLPVAAMESLMPYFRSAERVLRETGRQGVAWTDKVRVLPRGQQLTQPSIDQSILEAVHQGLFFSKRIMVGYRPRTAPQAKEYPVHPLGLVLRNDLLYLVCTVRKYPDIRQLLLHRMESAQVMEEAATVPDGFTLDAYIADQGFDWSFRRPDLRLKMRMRAMPAAALYETPLSQDQTIEPDSEGWTILTATVGDTAQLRWWILGYGEQVVVLEPENLREEMRGRVEVLRNAYIAVEASPHEVNTSPQGVYTHG
jgi:predicted DNA-binding transcriptional regulator YafY